MGLWNVPGRCVFPFTMTDRSVHDEAIWVFTLGGIGTCIAHETMRHFFGLC